MQLSCIYSLSHSEKYTSGADRVGIISAIICGVHCLVIPAVFLLKYSVTDGVEAAGWGVGLPHWWEWLDYIFLAVGFYAVFHSARHASSKLISVALWIFWLFLAIAVLFEDTLHWMAYFASAGLVITHFLNIRKHARRHRKHT